jgi:hypothetical protein
VLSVGSEFGRELDNVNGMLATKDEKHCVLGASTLSEGDSERENVEWSVAACSSLPSLGQ